MRFQGVRGILREEFARIKGLLQSVYDELKPHNEKDSAEDVNKLHHKLVFLLGSDYEHEIKGVQ